MPVVGAVHCMNNGLWRRFSGHRIYPPPVTRGHKIRVISAQIEFLGGTAACGQCGGKLKSLGEDVTEEMEHIQGRFVVNRIVRPPMACACCENKSQTPLPSRPIDRGCPGPWHLALLLVSKYADRLPLFRTGAPGSKGLN